MIAEEVINKFIRDVINLVLSTSDFAIRSMQDAPRPTGNYAAVEFMSDMGLGWEQQQVVNRGGDDDLDETIEGLRELMFSLSFYRDSAIDNARAVRTRFVRESIQTLLKIANLGLIRRSEVRSFSEPLENGWEIRAQFDLFLSAVGSDTDIVRSILAVDIAGEFQARGLIYNLTIEV